MKTFDLREKEVQNEWVNSIWPGNPDLNYEAALKHFTNPYNRVKTPIWVWGNKEGFNYTVAAGANSDYSYTGFCVGCVTLEQAKQYINDLPKRKIFK